MDSKIQQLIVIGPDAGYGIIRGVPSGVGGVRVDVNEELKFL